MKTKLFQTACLSLVAFLIGGCAQFILPSASQIKALAQDNNSLEIHVVTIYGTLEMRRNMTNSAPFVVPATLTIKQ